MTSRNLLTRLLLAAFLLLCIPLAHAYHYPWDQGHDVTNWNDANEPGTCKASTCTCALSTNSPVFIPTGHFIWPESDIVLPGRPRIELTRTYNSHDPRNGLFGNGWSAGCDLGLYKASRDGVSYYLLRNSDGKRYEYTRQNDGSYAPPAGRFERVQPQAGGQADLLYPDGSRLSFNADGRLISETDRNGNRLNYTFATDGRLTRIADTNGRYLDISYNGRYRVDSVADHSGRRWQYGYDSDGNLISLTDPAGGMRRYQYTNYTPVGDGQTYRHLTRVSDESGVVETQVSYSGERVTSYTQGADTYTYSYNTAGKTVTKTDSQGSRWTFVYTDAGLITRDTDPLGYSVTHAFDSNGRVTQTTDELGQVWTATYDSQGRATSRSNPLNQTTTFVYSGNNPAPIRITSPGGRVTQITYDARYNPITVTDPVGAITRLEWSAQGDLTAIVDALGQRSTITYNAWGQPLTTSDPLGRVSRFSYDTAGNQTHVQNPAGEIVHSDYDALGRATQVTDPLGGNTRFAYDTASRLLSLTDPAGATTAYAYDAYGRRIERTAPDGRKTRYAYRSDNLLNQLTQPDNRVTSFTYDAGKRLTQENAAGLVTTFGYDARGDLTSASNAAGTISRSYDTAGHLSAETNNGKTLQFSRNNEGERTARHVVTDFSLINGYTMDARGLVTAIADAGGSYQFGYDAAGQRNLLRLPNSGSAAYGYDAAGQLQSLAHSGPYTTTYGQTYDAAGRITRISGDGADWNYRYDGLGRLIQADHGGEHHAYAYDAVGNLQGNGRVHDVANRLTEDAGTTYSYDANGNLTRKQDKASGAHTDYTWNARNQLIAYTRYPDAGTTPSKSLTFTYDAFGRRASKSEDGVLQRYVYDGEDLIGVLDASGNLVTHFTFGPGIDEPLGMASSAGNRYYHANHLGSVMAMTDGAGVASQYHYTPYGATTVTGETGNPFRYTGREMDAEDLYYYRARHYDPGMGRFISEDPIGLAGGSNQYGYVGGDPLSYVDPLGLKTYRCTKPLNALTDKFGSGISKWAHDNVPAAYHQYSCVVDNKGKITCGGQDHTGSAMYSPGKPSDDSKDAGQCRQTEPDNKCFEQCLVAEWGKPRPTYGIPFGQDCQEYDDDVNQRCRKQCKK